jgi:hypothetical protein
LLIAFQAASKERPLSFCVSEERQGSAYIRPFHALAAFAQKADLTTDEHG